MPMLISFWESIAIRKVGLREWGGGGGRVEEGEGEGGGREEGRGKERGGGI